MHRQCETAAHASPEQILHRWEMFHVDDQVLEHGFDARVPRCRRRALGLRDHLSDVEDRWTKRQRATFVYRG